MNNKSKCGLIFSFGNFLTVSLRTYGSSSFCFIHYEGYLLECSGPWVPRHLLIEDWVESARIRVLLQFVMF